MKYTYYGDANLDGVVDTVDFNYLASSFGGGGVWAGGDFDYSGVVDSLDFSKLAANFGKASPIPGAALGGAAGAGALVPEPASVGLIGFGAAALLSARRRRRGG